MNDERLDRQERRGLTGFGHVSGEQRGTIASRALLRRVSTDDGRLTNGVVTVTGCCTNGEAPAVNANGPATSFTTASRHGASRGLTAGGTRRGGPARWLRTWHEHEQSEERERASLGERGRLGLHFIGEGEGR